jgi:hypothetical protein
MVGQQGLRLGGSERWNDFSSRRNRVFFSEGWTINEIQIVPWSILQVGPVIIEVRRGSRLWECRSVTEFRDG